MVREQRCVGDSCRRGAHDEHRQQSTINGSRLCSTCRRQLIDDLRKLPRLYSDIEQVLGGGRTAPKERSSADQASGLPFNAAASELRSTIVEVLSSWTLLVVAERAGSSGPGRSVGSLTGFLMEHRDMLLAHEAADDFSFEMADLVRKARRLVDPEPVRRIPLGPCPSTGCRGALQGLVKPDSAARTAEVRCDTDPSHCWNEHEWLELRREMRGVAISASTPGQRLWLSAADIARIGRVSPDSVYRMACESGWRRRFNGRRAYYHEADVLDTLRKRAARRGNSGARRR